MANVPKMMTIAETAIETGLPVHFLRQLVLQRKIVFVKAGSKYLINFDRLIEYLNHGDTHIPETEKTTIRRIV